MHGTFGLEPQHHTNACVYWSVEWLLRAAGIAGLPGTGVARSIEDHLVKMAPGAKPCYGTVVDAAKGLYPSASSLQVHDFTGRSGKDKVAELQRLWPTHFFAWTLLISINSGTHFYHSMPVLELLGNQITLLKKIDAAGTPILEHYALSDLESNHHKSPGGRDFASIVR